MDILLKDFQQTKILRTFKGLETKIRELQVDAKRLKIKKENVEDTFSNLHSEFDKKADEEKNRLHDIIASKNDYIQCGQLGP